MDNTSYTFDRHFTDVVHNNLACKIIYPKLEWIIQDVNSKMLDSIDTKNAIDYIAIDKKQMKTITIQERFREKRYSNYSDFTIRYKRDFNPHEDRKLSEYFKLDADYFVYGIINQDKYRVEEAKEFIKYCVIDINKFKNYIDKGKIVIEEASNLRNCIIKNDKLICPVIENHDFSSSFFPVDIVLLSQLFGNELIILQDGFIK